MTKISAIFKKNLDLIFFYLFILTLPFQKRHIFNLDSATWEGHFFEWGAFALYLSDIFLGLTIIAWIIKALVLKFEKGNLGKSIPYQKMRMQGLFALLFAFLVVALLSTIRSDSLEISFYRFFRVFEGGLLFAYIVKNISTITSFIKSITCFVIAAFFQAMLGMLQYLLQKSVGWKFLGEVDLAPTIQNVAKIDVAGEKLIRAYGTMPHANVLGGFLLIGLIFSLLLVMLTLLKKENLFLNIFQSNSISLKDDRQGKKPVDKAKTRQKKTLRVLAIVFFAVYFGLILSFSRSAYLAILLSPILFIISLSFFKEDYLKKLLEMIRYFIKQHKTLLVVLILLLVIFTGPFVPHILSKTTVSEQIGDYSVQGRLWYAEIAVKMLRTNPDFGVGPGMFTLNMSEYVSSETDMKWWQYQPVHNVILLISAELGITCLLLFIAFIGWLISLSYITFKRKNFLGKLLLSVSLISLFGLIVIMQFDHYLWTLQQGSLLLWFIIGLAATATTKLR